MSIYTWTSAGSNLCLNYGELKADNKCDECSLREHLLCLLLLSLCLSLSIVFFLSVFELLVGVSFFVVVFLRFSFFQSIIVIASITLLALF